MRYWIWFGALLVLLAQTTRSAEFPVTQYLVEGRVHVALIYRTDGAGGEIAWRDTVSGQSGDALFEVHGDSLWFESADGAHARARVLPNLALLFENTPWRNPPNQVALGLSVD